MKLTLLLKMIKKRKMQFILMIVQLSISIMAFAYVGSYALDTYEQYKSTKQLLNVDRMLYVSSKSTIPIDTSNLVEVYEEIKKLQEENIIKNVKALAKSECDFPELEAVAKKYDSGESYNTMILVSEEFMKDYPVRIKEGRNFTKEDFDLTSVRDEEPIIIGEGLSEYLKVGQVISIQYDLPMGLLPDIPAEDLTYTRKYKVIGIAEKDSLMDFTSITDFSHAVIDNFIIYKPFNKVRTFIGNSEGVKLGELNELESAIISSNAIIEAADGVDMENLIGQLNIILKKYDLSKMEFRKLDNTYNRRLDETKNMFVVMTGLTLMILIFSLSGVLGTTLFLIRKRYTEFGIHLSLGATVNDIIKLVLSELALMTLISTIIGYIGAYYLLKDSHLYNAEIMLQRLLYFSLIVFIPILGLMIITASVRLKKINPVELLRGDS